MIHGSEDDHNLSKLIPEVEMTRRLPLGIIGALWASLEVCEGWLNNTAVYAGAAEFESGRRNASNRFLQLPSLNPTCLFGKAVLSYWSKLHHCWCCMT